MSVGRGRQRTTAAATWGETTATKEVRGATTRGGGRGRWRRKVGGDDSDKGSVWGDSSYGEDSKGETADFKSLF